MDTFENRKDPLLPIYGIDDFPLIIQKFENGIFARNGPAQIFEKLGVLS